MENCIDNFKNVIDVLIKIQPHESIKFNKDGTHIIPTLKRTCIQNFFGWFIHLITLTLVPRNPDLDKVTKWIFKEFKSLKLSQNWKWEEHPNAQNGFFNLKNTMIANGGRYQLKVESILKSFQNKNSKQTFKSLVTPAHEKSGAKESCPTDNPIFPAKPSNPTQTTFNLIHLPDLPKTPTIAEIDESKKSKNSFIDYFFHCFSYENYDHQMNLLKSLKSDFFETFDYQQYLKLIENKQVVEKFFQALEKSNFPKVNQLFEGMTDLLFRTYHSCLSENLALKNKIYECLSEEQQLKLPLERYNAAIVLFLDDRLDICEQTLLSKKCYELTDEESKECEKLQLFEENAQENIDENSAKEYLSDIEAIILQEANKELIEKTLKVLINSNTSSTVNKHFFEMLKRLPDEILERQVIPFLGKLSEAKAISKLITNILNTKNDIVLPHLFLALEKQPWKFLVFLKDQSEERLTELQTVVTYPICSGVLKNYSIDSSLFDCEIKMLSEFLRQPETSKLINLKAQIPSIVQLIIDGILKIREEQMHAYINSTSQFELMIALTETGIQQKLFTAILNGMRSVISPQLVLEHLQLVRKLETIFNEESREYKKLAEFGDKLYEQQLMHHTRRDLFPKESSSKTQDSKQLDLENKTKEVLVMLSNTPRKLKKKTS